MVITENAESSVPSSVGKRIKTAAVIIVVCILIASICQNVWYYFQGFDSYLQDTDEICMDIPDAP